MKQEEIDEIEKILEPLSIMEIDYFRNWLMEKYPIYAMDHAICTILDTMDGVGAEYNDVMNILKNIKDQSKWELDISYFIENEKSGYYRIIEAQQIIDKLTEIDFENFKSYLREKYPIYNTIKYIDYYETYNNTFGQDNYPKWDEIYEIVKYEKYK